MSVFITGVGIALAAFWIFGKPRGSTDPQSITTSGFEVSGEWRVEKTVGTVGDTDFTVQGYFRTEAAGVKREIVGKDAEGNLLYAAVNVPEKTSPPSKDRHDWRAAELIATDDLSLLISAEMISYSDAEEAATERYDFRRDAASGGGEGLGEPTTAPTTPSTPPTGGSVGDTGTPNYDADSFTGYPQGISTSVSLTDANTTGVATTGMENDGGLPL